MFLRRNVVYLLVSFKGLRVTYMPFRNRIYTFLIALSIFSLTTLFLHKRIHIVLQDISIKCNKSEIWEIFSIPGQIRTLRIKFDDETNTSSEIQTILLWTTYFSEEYSNDFYFFKKGQQIFKQYKCKFSECFITSNRSLLPSANAVLFHARDLNFSDIPERPHDDQIWILYSMEPPRYMRLKWNLIRSLFNWTMTYRSDSDVQVKYGEIIARNDSCMASSGEHKSVYDRPKGALWMVSNCRTESRREAYVKELKKFFNVDVYGKCSRKRKCVPSQSDICYKMLNNYKYYLSFENSICKDYITEKFFNILKYDVVPVVLGGGDYSAIAPNNSFIDATQYPDPEQLAKHLTKIASNSTWYDSFFEWKSHYSVHLYPWMCHLCERLYQSRSTPQTLPKKLWSWWIPGAICRKWTKMKVFKNISDLRSPSSFNLNI